MFNFKKIKERRMERYEKYREKWRGEIKSIVREAMDEGGSEVEYLRPNIDTAPKIGIESKKEILAASTLLKFNNLEAVIAIPDLLTPGIKDKT